MCQGVLYGPWPYGSIVQLANTAPFQGAGRSSNLLGTIAHIDGSAIFCFVLQRKKGVGSNPTIGLGNRFGVAVALITPSRFCSCGLVGKARDF